MAENILNVTDASFDNDVLKATMPVLIDFWAEWCGPCRMVAPVVEEVANQYAGKLQVVKINIDENEAIPSKYGIRGIPTLMVVKDGEVVATKVGAVTKAQLVAFLESSLNI